MAEVLVMVDADEIAIDLPEGLFTGEGRSLTRVVMGCRLGPLDRREDEVRTTLHAHFRFLEGDGRTYASEWVETGVIFQHKGAQWSGRVGLDRCWSTDWPK